MTGFPKTIPIITSSSFVVLTPRCTHHGLGSFPFARRYSENRFFFLFLRLLRCFSSPGSPCIPMYSVYSDGAFLRRVSPFRYPHLSGYLLLSTAFRSLSRLSSAPSAKASALRPFLLDLFFRQPSVTGFFYFFLTFWFFDVFSWIFFYRLYMQFSRYLADFFCQPSDYTIFFIYPDYRQIFPFFNPAATCSPMPSPA